MPKVVLFRNQKANRFVAAVVVNTYRQDMGADAATAAREISEKLSKGSYETPESAREAALSVLSEFRVPPSQTEFNYRG